MTHFFRTSTSLSDMVRQMYRDYMYVDSAANTMAIVNMSSSVRANLNDGNFDAVPNLALLTEMLGYVAKAGENGARRYYRFREMTTSEKDDFSTSPAFIGAVKVALNRWAVWAYDMDSVHFYGVTRGTFARFYTFDGTWSDVPEVDSDLVVQPLTGWGSGFSLVTPAPQLLEGLPAAVREAAVAAIPSSTSGPRTAIFETEDGFELRSVPTSAAGDVTATGLIAQAREIWRDSIRSRMGMSVRDEEAEAQRQAHRALTRENFAAFARREIGTEDHIPTLPFVPHGLASSRRWGIEVESGGARGVETPDGWRGIGDGSLRSAYDGWREVQDFEPYDEPYEELVYASNCEGGDHNPRIEIWDEGRGEMLWAINPNYTDARECTSCGRQQRVRRVEPQTIVHHAQSGDCREFVSPILVSMHSKGLEYLCEELSKRPQNDSSGVHVHVEASDLTPEQIATLVYGYDLLEPLLEPSYHRNARQYCQRRDVEAVLEAARSVRSGNGIDTDGGSRYMTLNTHALSEHGTIEFRAMGPVYNYDTLTRWAMFCRELVNAVANGATNKDFAQATTWQGVLQLLAKFGQEYVRASVFEMTGETGEVAKLLKEDANPTVEALNADLAAAWDNVANLMRRAAIPMERLAERLVGVGSSEV